MSVQDLEFDSPVSWPSNGISEVPFRLYTDPEQYRVEQERIFKGPTWNYLCLAAEIPGPGDWVATTDGYVNAQIQPQVSGYLVRQNYKEGGTVRKGQVLFEIDPRPLEAVVNETKGSLAQAQAQLELAGINVNRDTPLAEAHAVAQSTLDNDLQTRQADRASVANAQASLQAAELNVGFTKVRSLIDGVAGQALMQVGSLVGQSSVLTSVSQLDPIKGYFYISEQEYLALSARARSGACCAASRPTTCPGS